jgi:hypothetical protein
MAQEVTAARERIEDIKAGIIDDEWFGPIAHSLTNRSPRPLPSTAPAKDHKLWVSAQRFCLEENGLMWLFGNLENKKVETNTRVKKKDEEKVEITVGTNETVHDSRSEMEEEAKVKQRGRLYIPRR